LDFANFYQTFIDSYLDKVQPLTELMYKGRVFDWSPEADRVFEDLKTAFILVLVLVYFDYKKPIKIETDSSGWCIKGTL